MPVKNDGSVAQVCMEVGKTVGKGAMKKENGKKRKICEKFYVKN